MTFEQFFTAATGNAPYDYQRRLACGGKRPDEADEEWLPRGTECASKRIEIPFDLSFMQMGEGQHGPSWLARAIALRDRLGPFRFAFFETMLRAADTRASARKSTATQP
jgi:hypothetical protein